MRSAPATEGPRGAGRRPAARAEYQTMRVLTESTERVVHLNRVPARIWEAVEAFPLRMVL